MKFFWSFITITIFCLASVSTSASVQLNDSRPYAVPKIQTKQLSLVSHADNSLDKLVMQILRETIGTDGEVKIIISRVNLSGIANKIKKQLVSQGISANRVTIIQSLDGFNTTAANASDNSGLAVVIETIKFQPDVCHYNNNYYDSHGNQYMGCAIKNNLQNSLVDPVNKIL